MGDKQDTGMTQAKEIFNSYLALFLEEGEINQLLKKFDVKKNNGIISKALFLENYARILLEITSDNADLGTDIIFHDLKLVVATANNEFKTIVNNCTGEIPARQMTAVMGGSGSGKTSLLNSLN